MAPFALRLERPELVRIFYISFLSVLVGIGGGILAFAIYYLIYLTTNLFFFHRLSFAAAEPDIQKVGPWVVLIVAAGGLMVALIAYLFNLPQVIGHGVPETVEAVHLNRGRFRARMMILKPLASAFSIGTGGPLGAEGPIVQTCGVLGSFIGQSLRITTYERRVLLACGATAGLAAAFNVPYAAVIFALELLVLELKLTSFVPLIIASATGTVVRHILLGNTARFSASIPSDVFYPALIPLVIVVGLLAGMIAIFIIKVHEGIEQKLEHSRLPKFWFPVMGGAVVGFIALFIPQVMGVGFIHLNAILNGKAELSFLLLLFVGKLAAWLIASTMGSSGGTLMPLILIGASLGAAVGKLASAVIPPTWANPEILAVVGMMALFGASMRATFTAILFGFEAVHDFNVIVPLMIGCVVADLVANLYCRDSLVTHLLKRRGMKLSLEYEADITEEFTVGEIMTREVKTIPADLKLSELLRRINDPSDELYAFDAFPIVDEEGRLVGIISRDDMVRIVKHREHADRRVIDLARTEVITATPDMNVHEAMMQMIRHRVGRLPVVDPNDPTKLVGIISRSDVLRCWLRDLEEHTEVEEPVYHLRRFLPLPPRPPSKEKG